MLDQWVRRALDEGKIGQAEMARHLTERLGRSIDRAAVNKMAKGTRKVAADELLAIVAITGVEAPSETEHDEVQLARVPIQGLIGAGGSIDTNVSQAYGSSDVHEIVLDIPVPPGVSAWEVWGSSMLPKYDPGDVILIQRAADPIDLLLGQVALVVTEDGRRMLKRILRGSEPGLYNLESFNAATMEDERVVEAGAIYVVVPVNQVQRPGTKEVARRYERRAEA